MGNCFSSDRDLDEFDRTQNHYHTNNRDYPVCECGYGRGYWAEGTKRPNVPPRGFYHVPYSRFIRQDTHGGE